MLRTQKIECWTGAYFLPGSGSENRGGSGWRRPCILLPETRGKTGTNQKSNGEHETDIGSSLHSLFNISHELDLNTYDCIIDIGSSRTELDLAFRLLTGVILKQQQSSLSINLNIGTNLRNKTIKLGFNTKRRTNLDQLSQI